MRSRNFLSAESVLLLKREFKFLRLELDLSQPALGVMLGKDQQAIARWEKGKTKVEPTADRLLRVIYRDIKMGDKTLKPMVDLLRRLGSTDPVQRKVIASERGENWSAKAEACV